MTRVYGSGSNEKCEMSFDKKNSQFGNQNNLICLVCAIMGVVLSFFLGLIGLAVGTILCLVAIFVGKSFKKHCGNDMKVTVGLVFGWIGVILNVIRVVIIIVTLIWTMNMTRSMQNYLNDISQESYDILDSIGTGGNSSESGGWSIDEFQKHTNGALNDYMGSIGW